MATVYKYAVGFGETTIAMPKGAIPTHFALQHGQPTVWCLVDPGRELVSRTFFLVGTGHMIPAQVGDLHPVGTVLEEYLVWHLFTLRDIA